MKKALLLSLFLLTLTASAETELVIGADERIQVSSYSDPFHQSVGQLRIGDNAHCTGTLIGPRHVLTNGHCVVVGESAPYSIRNAKDFRFIPGRLYDGHSPFGVIRVVKVLTFKKWVKKDHADYDVAVLELEEEVNLPVIELGVVRHPQYLVDFPLSIAGYSGDKSFGTMWEASGAFLKMNPESRNFYHNVDTFPGNSGSLIRIQQGAGKNWVAIGIHRASATSNGKTVNEAVLFDQPMSDAIKRCLKQ